MLTGVRLLKIEMPAGREFWLTALFGIVLLGGGNALSSSPNKLSQVAWLLCW